MNADLWRRAKEIVGDALERPVSERAALIEARCGGDEALLNEVKAYLAAASDTADFLAPIERLLQAAPTAADHAGRRLGAYRLLREIGRGGMSVVYIAERADGAYEQHVAVKLMQSSNSADAPKRVARERQALATLDHPNIARLIDGGIAPDGMAYLVMDYVDGTRIDDWCQQNNRSLKQRVTLMLAVCEAVQHAHQQLIVHRDIKPANILVNQQGTPKLLDFGVARLLETASEQTDVTQAGALLFTPRYASPEQVKGLPANVSADVYGLGMLLYELLAGSSPFVRISSNQATSAAAAMQAVLEDECRKASKVAADYQPAHVELLKGDLDTILAKACARDPGERYQTVAEIKDDLQRWLEDRPILSRQPSWRYQATKFVRRHRMGSALGLLSIVAIAAGVAGTIVQKNAADERYRQALTLAGKVTSKYYDAIESLPGSTSVRKDIATDALAFLDALAKGAGADPAIQVELATGYQRLGEVLFNGRGLPHVGDRAAAQAAREKSLALVDDALMAQPTYFPALRTRARVLSDRAAQQGAMGEFDAAFRNFDASIATYQRALELGDDPDVRYQFARTYVSAGQAAITAKRTAKPYLDLARVELDRWKKSKPNDKNGPPFEAFLLRTQDREARRIGDWQSALTYQEQEIALIESEMAKYPEDATYWLHMSVVQLNSGVIYRDHLDPIEAAKRMRRAIELTQRILDKDPTNVGPRSGLARMHLQLGRCYSKTKDTAAMLASYRESVRLWEAVAGKDLQAYQVTQMGESYWELMQASRSSDKTLSRSIAQRFIAHAERHPKSFAEAPSRDWVQAARDLLK